MKIVDTTKPERFRPITLEITIESEAELVELYHRMNITQTDVKNAYKGGWKEPRLESSAELASTEIWSHIERHIDERGLDALVWKDETTDY